MKTPVSSLRALGCALPFFLSFGLLQAADYTWNATSGAFTTGGNWVGDVAAPSGNNILLTNGTLGTPATTTFTGSGNYLIVNFTSGAYNTFTVNTTPSTNFLRFTGAFNNAGIVENGTGNVWFQVNNPAATNPSAVSVNSGTIRAANPGVFWLDLSVSPTAPNLTNTGGLLLAKNGSILRINTVQSTTQAVTGGTLRSDVGGTITNSDSAAALANLRLADVTVDNQGTFTSAQQHTGTVTSTRLVDTILTGTTVFTNASGATVNVLNTGGGTGLLATQLNSSFTLAGNASFDNRGLLNITNDTTRAGASLTTNSLTFAISSATATFSNTGTLRVINDATATGATAVFTSVKSITNEGTVRIKGNASNTGASFTVTGSGNNYTQSGTGLRTLLERGGLLSAENVFINSGDLGGVGTVSGIDVNIGSGGRVVVADTLAAGAGAGELVFNSNLTFEDGADVVFALGADTAGSGRVLLGVGNSLVIGDTVTLSIRDLNGSAATGTTYRLFSLNGGSVTGTFVLDTLPAGWDGYLTTGADYVDFTFGSALIPEPSTYALLVGGLTVWGVIGIRRRR